VIDLLAHGDGELLEKFPRIFQRFLLRPVINLHGVWGNHLGKVGCDILGRCQRIGNGFLAVPEEGVITKRTEITIEMEEVAYVVTRRNGLTRAWCRVCGTEVTIVPPEDGSATAKVSGGTLNRWVEGDSDRFMETPDNDRRDEGHSSD
jgi:hypothetical protein